jgi:lysyl-tRNA synthetase, class II
LYKPPESRPFSACSFQRFVSSDDSDHPGVTKEVKERVAELRRADLQPYPRLPTPNTLHPLKSIASPPPESHITEAVQVAGRIVAIRHAGKKLSFLDVQHDGHITQVKLSLSGMTDLGEENFAERVRLLRRGDHVTVQGSELPTPQGQIGISAMELPTLIAPCLQRLPKKLPSSARDSDNDASLGRHVEMLTYDHLLSDIRLRANLIRSLRAALEKDSFTEVQTPILAATAGGAAARAFVTHATEFPHRVLSLRIAPELWLKRLVVGGLDKVFELGPSFRNEGIDKTHNPEFTTCEFYAAYMNLSQLIAYTELLLRTLGSAIANDSSISNFDHSVINEWMDQPVNSFPQIDFITSINEALGHSLPDLTSPTAQEDVVEIFRSKSIPLPSLPTLPRMLDKLCSHYLEPKCHSPTWIVNTPECLSPLAKSFTHPSAPHYQPVAARAELFIRGKEVVNCYEEENSPFEQRRKFIDQQRLARLDASGSIDDEAMAVDEDYIGALEWGMPPTGGWGAGIDRLVMLASGRERITDVLSCGNLRAVTRGAQKVEKKTTGSSTPMK